MRHMDVPFDHLHSGVRSGCAAQAGRSLVRRSSRFTGRWSCARPTGASILQHSSPTPDAKIHVVEVVVHYGVTTLTKRLAQCCVARSHGARCTHAATGLLSREQIRAHDDRLIATFARAQVGMSSGPTATPHAQVFDDNELPVACAKWDRWAARLVLALDRERDRRGASSEGHLKLLRRQPRVHRHARHRRVAGRHRRAAGRGSSRHHKRNRQQRPSRPRGRNRGLPGAHGCDRQPAYGPIVHPASRMRLTWIVD